MGKITLLLLLILSSASYAQDWKSNYYTDNMRGTVRRALSIESENSVKFNFPYDENSKMELMLASNGVKLKKDQKLETIMPSKVALRIKSGQFSCIVYNGCTVSVKFDDKPISKYKMLSSSDGSADIIFMQNSNSFIRDVNRYKKLIVEANFFQEGSRQFIFNLDGYKERLSM